MAERACVQRLQKEFRSLCKVWFYLVPLVLLCLSKSRYEWHCFNLFCVIVLSD